MRNKYVPGSTIVGVPRWAIYHSERNFTGPDDFRPEGGLRMLSGLMLVTTERHSILSAMGRVLALHKGKRDNSNKMPPNLITMESILGNK